jgi:DNA polymerase-1
MSQKTLYLIDGSGFIFRAFHALPPLSRKDGTPVGAVFGFANMLLRTMADWRAEHMAVIFDAGRQTFRNKLYPEYKANRSETPPDLIPQFSLIRQLCQSFHVPIVEKEGFEADDLIATYAKQAVQKGFKVVIISSDKDLMQLVDDDISMFDPMKAKPIHAAEVQEKFGVEPKHVIDILALAGDSSDNIPGVPSIGLKTATELVLKFGTVEEILKNAHHIPQTKRRETLIAHADDARLSKQLVALEEDVPLDVPLSDLIRKPFDMDVTIAFLHQQDFRSLEGRIRNMFDGGKMGFLPHTQEAKPTAAPAAKTTVTIPTPHDHPKDYQLVQTLEQLKSWLEKIDQHKVVAIDTETTSLNAVSAELVGISLSVKDGEACYIPVGHRATDMLSSVQQLPLDLVLEHIRPLCANPAILKVGHNIKYDKLVLKKYQVDIHPFADTMLISYLLGETPRHGLDLLTSHYVGHTMTGFKELVGLTKSAKNFSEVPLADALNYAAADADFTGRLYRHLYPLLQSSPLHTVYQTIDLPLVDILVDMENTGMVIDPAVLRKLSLELATRMKKLEDQIVQLAGQPFNVASPKQLGEILFGKLKLPGGKKGKNGDYSTNADALEELAAQHPLPALALEWRQLAKLKSTYTDTLIADINPKTGRVHTSFSMAGTTTGRLASSDPNLQNIPIRTEEGKKIRTAFIAAPGHKLISLDYSQIELRLLAHMADVPTIRQAFMDGIDIHAATASQIFNAPLKDVTQEMRSHAKTINFGLIYGMSAFGLAAQLKISREQAAQYIEAYHTQYPGIKAYMEEMKEFARQHGYVETLFKRRCYIADIQSKNGNIRAMAERQAINAPLQGSNADIIKRAMNDIPKALLQHKLHSKMVLQVHDELLIEAPIDEVDATIQVVKKIMESVVTLKVPLKVGTGVGNNWSEAH